MSDSSNVAVLGTDSSEAVNNQWIKFKITDPVGLTNSQTHSLLKNTMGIGVKTSIFNDITIKSSGLFGKFKLDRIILASKSDYLFELLIRDNEKDFFDEVERIMSHNYAEFSTIVELLYGKDLKQSFWKDNFAGVFECMHTMKMEIDLKIFKNFIEETIKQRPKEASLNHMFRFYNILSNSDHEYDYLLPTVSQYFSDRLLKIENRKEFLSWSANEFIQILLNKSEDPMEKVFIGRVCAEWVCNDFRNRINHLKDLVNATKYRYGLFPYCDWNPDLMKSSQKKSGSDQSRAHEVEKLFNELLHYHGDVQFYFASTSILKDELNRRKSRVKIARPINQIERWTTFLDRGLFCDVAINVQGTVFKLHRVRLFFASGYFYKLFTGENSPSRHQMKEYSLDQIDPETFQSIIQYIYTQEIEITSQTHLINLLKGSRFLKMNDFFEKCSSAMLKIAREGTIGNIFEAFQYACENSKYAELYNLLSTEIASLWSGFFGNPEFQMIDLEILKEILSLQILKLENADEFLVLCSKWILHDIENRYRFIIQIAKAINRNFMMDDQAEPEIPSDLGNLKVEYVKDQLTRILSSSALVSLNTDCTENEKRNPKFLLLNKHKFLSVMDVNFNEIVQLAKLDETKSRYSGTVINDKLFVIFNIGEQFNFLSCSLTSKRIVLLASDSRMCSKKDYVILSCNDKIYYCDGVFFLEYRVELNRWISVLKEPEEDCICLRYTSDGGKIYKIIISCSERSKEWRNEVSFYDFEQKIWTAALPNIPLDTQDVIFKESKKDHFKRSIKLNMVNQELCMLFLSRTYFFNWNTQTWKSISNSNNNFVEFCEHDENILYFSDDKVVHTYSPVSNKCVLRRKLHNCNGIVAIHMNR